MTANEAYEGLSRTLGEIAEELTKSGLSAESRCVFTGIDFDEFDEYCTEVRVLAGEIILRLPCNDQGAVLECAVGIDDGQVTNDELIREISAIRAEARHIIDLCESSDSPEEALNKLYNEEADESGESHEADFNDSALRTKSALDYIKYISIAIGIIALIVLMIALR